MAEQAPCRILRVDLTREKTSIWEIPWDECKLWLGGKSLAYYLGYKLIPPGTDPLSPGNRLIFAAGFLNAVAPGASKVSVLAKSPLTRLLHDSHAGDYFGPYLRKSGLNAIVVEGRLSSPGYLWIRDGEAEIRSADKLWGKTVSEATDAIRRETSLSASVAAIGPAGENLVKYAHI
ncbi:MAG: aldehyde ferredoxin oxidoreductase, partial [Desulfurococcales archaeon]|nr:aldehyde ferredoxin oxidoreductase [Desulfurococcales archaeon]